MKCYTFFIHFIHFYTLFSQEPFVTYRDCDTLPADQRHLSHEPEPVHSAIRAVFTFASALQTAHADLCLSAEGLCHSLARLAGDEFMERYLRPLGYDNNGDMVDLKMGVCNYKDRNGSFAFEQVRHCGSHIHRSKLKLKRTFSISFYIGFNCEVKES